MFNNLISKNNREGDDRPAPIGTLPRLWDMLCNHFFKLLWANFLCVICCIPIVTIPASICGLFAVIQQYYRKGYGDVNVTFFKEFRQDFFQRILLTLILLFVPVVGLVLGSLFGGWAALAICALTVVLSILTLSWLYSQMTLLAIRPLHAFRNAFLLTALESKRDLILILIWVIFGGALAVFWPISLLSLLFLMPGVPVTFIYLTTESVLEERIIGKADTSEREADCV